MGISLKDIFSKFMDNENTIKESSLSRIWQHVEESDRTFAVIAAGRPDYSKDEIRKMYNNLKQDVRSMGYGYVEMKGSWKDESGQVIEEPSLFIPNIKRKESIKLGKMYEQDSILYKGKDIFEEIRTNPNKGGVGKTLQKLKMGSGADNLSLKKKLVKDFFSSLVKGSHAGKKFLFQLKEREMSSFNRIAYHDEPLKWYIILEEEIEI